MPIIKVPAAGAIGVNKDLSAAEMPPNAWTDASNIRFLDGYAHQAGGYGAVYSTPSGAPQHVFPCNVAGERYWIYTTASGIYGATISGGAATHTDLTHATPRTGVVNQWTSTLLSGIPILNSGDATHVPMSWDLNTANNFVNLANWPANTYCKSLRAYKNSLIALNITKTTTRYPYMVKWSTPADPGSVPSSWDETDATKDAGETDLAEGFDQIIDGLQLRDSFMIYKEQSVWRMDYIGGPFVYRFSKVGGISGTMNRNCIVELDGQHLVLTSSDVVVHDGQKATTVLDKMTRRFLFQDIDTTYIHLCFVFKNPFLNEVFVCYPSVDSTVCNKALVWNYKDNTCSFRSLPSVNHANYGPVDTSLSGTWAGDPDVWEADTSIWGGPELVPFTTRVLMATSDSKLLMLDNSASFEGAIPSAYLERRGLSMDAPDRIKLVRGIRPRILGNTGQTVNIQIGSSDDPYANPTYSTTMSHTIGSTVANDCFVTGRYIAVRFSTGTAYSWRLDSYDLDVTESGAW